MAKIVVRLPEPKEEYEVSNQKQINRAITLVVEQLNSTFLNEQNIILKNTTWTAYGNKPCEQRKKIGKNGNDKNYPFIPHEKSHKIVTKLYGIKRLLVIAGKKFQEETYENLTCPYISYILLYFPRFSYRFPTIMWKKPF